MASNELLLWVNDTLKVALKNSRFRIGRVASQNDIHIPDPSVSSRHCLLHNGTLTDHGSTNGTILNGQQCEYKVGYKLKASDIIQLGTTRLFVVERGKTPDDYKGGGLGPKEGQEEGHTAAGEDETQPGAPKVSGAAGDVDSGQDGDGTGATNDDDSSSDHGDDSSSSDDGEPWEPVVHDSSRSMSGMDTQMDPLAWLPQYDSKKMNTRRVVQAQSSDVSEVKEDNNKAILESEVWRLKRDVARSQSANLALRRRINLTQKTTRLASKKQMDALNAQLASVEWQLEQYGEREIQKRVRAERKLITAKRLELETAKKTQAHDTQRVKIAHMQLEEMLSQKRELEGREEKGKLRARDEAQTAAELKESIVVARVEVAVTKKEAELLKRHMGGLDPAVASRMSDISQGVQLLGPRLRTDLLLFLSCTVLVLSVLLTSTFSPF